MNNNDNIKLALLKLNESNDEIDTTIYDDEEDDDVYGWEFLDDIDDDDVVSDEEMEFSTMMKEFIHSLLQMEKNSPSIVEAFSSDKKLNDHFTSHCIAKDKTKKSNRQNVYYDFDDVKQYENYEYVVYDDLTIDREKTQVIDNLFDYENIIKAFWKLFEGDRGILFTPLCGFEDNGGNTVSIGFRSFSTNYTKNYSGGNTIDFLVVGNKRTKTLYPLDASYVENKFNNCVKRMSKKFVGKFNINH